MTSALQRSVRLGLLAPWLLGGFVFVVAVWAAQPYAVGVFHDDGAYVTLGKALATGEGYRYLNLPGTPVATHYPPGYPLLLAALWKIAPNFPQNVAVFQLANAVVLALTAWGVVAFARRWLGWTQPVAIVAALVGTLSYPLLGLSGHVLSEPLFAAALFPALMLAERAARDSAATRDAWLAGAAVGVLTLVRAHGIALIAALVLVLALRNRWRQAAFATAAAVLVLAPWQLYVAAHDHEIVGELRGKYASYLPWLIEGFRGGAAFAGATIATNVREINLLLADRFSLSDHALPRLVTGIVAGAFVVLGAIRFARKAPVTAAFAAFYMAILLVWPWTPSRFLHAIWPIVILFLGEAIHWLLALRPQSRMAASTGLVLTTALVLGAVRAEHRAYRERSWYQAAQHATRSIAPLMRWVAANTRPADVVAVEAEQLVYLFTGRRALPPQTFTAGEYVVPPSINATTQSLRRVLSEFPVTVVATISPQVYRAAQRLADNTAAPAPHLVLLQTFTGGGAFRVERRVSLTTQP